MNERTRGALILAAWVIFAAIGVIATAEFIVRNVFLSGGRCYMTHQCPIPNCATNVPTTIFMCPRHWRMVPKPLQDAVYQSYRTTGRISENHREAVRVVQQAEQGRNTIGLSPGTNALTVWQPWASLIILGAKPYEFRRWNFADKPHLAKLIGTRIVIHAGARRPPQFELDEILYRIDEGESALDAKIARPLVREMRAALHGRGKDADLHMAPLGVALGTAIIGDPRSVLDIFKDVVADSGRLDHSVYGWPLTDIQRFEHPIPSAGAQGFWNWS